MTENLQIDNLDRKILDIITKNARIPYLEVARECGVSGAAIHQRVQRLIRIGVIKGSEFKVDPVMVGFRTCAYIGVFLDHPGHYREVIKKFKDIPETLSTKSSAIGLWRHLILTAFIARHIAVKLKLEDKIKDKEPAQKKEK